MALIESDAEDNPPETEAQDDTLQMQVGVGSFDDNPFLDSTRASTAAAAAAARRSNEAGVVWDDAPVRQPAAHAGGDTGTAELESRGPTRARRLSAPDSISIPGMESSSSAHASSGGGGGAGDEARTPGTGGTLESLANGDTPSSRRNKGHRRQLSAPVIGGIGASGLEFSDSAHGGQEVRLAPDLIVTRTGTLAVGSVGSPLLSRNKSPAAAGGASSSLAAPSRLALSAQQQHPTTTHARDRAGSSEDEGEDEAASAPAAKSPPSISIPTHPVVTGAATSATATTAEPSSASSKSASPSTSPFSGSTPRGAARLGLPLPTVVEAEESHSLFNHEELETLGFIGKGTAGTVTKCLHVTALVIVAVKAVAVFDAERRESTVAELRALHRGMISFREMGSPQKRALADESCIVGFYDAFLAPGGTSINLVLEWMDGGSLQDLVDAKVKAGVRIPEEFNAVACMCMLRGLCELHEQRLLHRDLKPANVLVSRSGAVKLSDFGVSIAFGLGSLSKAQTFVGSLSYMAPERVHGEDTGYSYAADLWAVGLIAYVVATGKYPYADVDGGFWGLIHAVVSEPSPELNVDDGHSPELADFVSQCLRKKPEERPTAAQLLGHPFIQKAVRMSSDARAQAVASQLEPINDRDARAELDRLLLIAHDFHAQRALQLGHTAPRVSSERIASLGKQLGVALSDEELSGKVETLRMGTTRSSVASTSPSSSRGGGTGGGFGFGGGAGRSSLEMSTSPRELTAAASAARTRARKAELRLDEKMESTV